MIPEKGKSKVAPDEIPGLIASLKKEMFDWARRWNSRRPPPFATESSSSKKCSSIWASGNHSLR